MCAWCCHKCSLHKSAFHPSPSRCTPESSADLPARRCVVQTRNKRLEDAALGMQGAKRGLARRSVVGKSHLLGTAAAGTGMLRRASAGPAAPPCGQPGKRGCCRHRDGSPPCSLVGALGREGRGASSGNEAAKSRPQFFYTADVYDLCTFSSLLFIAYSKVRHEGITRDFLLWEMRVCVCVCVSAQQRS